ncbi:unnamed protein product [Microthlaspi erraticum]|uniref:Putative gamma-glutamylcyclotransferase n=1 Tax=Microthlaspi erraticum TaxID=1685480 RepID=A0A6D2KTE4_9BRAS|nr:unnamed protein product [Microthlaspi erraticum]
MSSSGPPLHNIFVYGSFQEPDVIKVILDRVPEMISATLPGFKMLSLKGRLYPCIVPSEEGDVHGKVLTGLNDKELKNLDTCEGNEYERVTVGAVRDDNFDKMPVKTYIWINKDDPEMDGEWDFEEWKRLHMKKFINTYKDIMESKRNPQVKESDPIKTALREEPENGPSS